MLQLKPTKARVIFHIDMNCFYASVEMAYNPKLKGLPLAIAGNPEERKGIIVTSSYEARAQGVKTTMPIWQARKLCPNLKILKPNFPRYQAASTEIFKFLASITPYVEPVSIDEGYIDVTDIDYEGGPVQLAHDIQKTIKDTLDLPCSIGIAPNKFLAKMASDMKKPLGVTILRKRDIHQKLWVLPIEEMYGVGNKTAEKLRKLGVETIKDLAEKDVYVLKQLLGINGVRLKNRANGIDVRPVDPDAVHDFKSIGSSQTLPEDTTDELELFQLMNELARNIERRMKRKEAVARTVQLMIRYHDRKTVTRSKALPMYIDDKEALVRVAKELFQLNWTGDPIRLLGITAQDLAEKHQVAQQLDLFTYEKNVEKDKLNSVIDELTTKYGKNPFIELKQKEKTDNTIYPRTSFQKDFLQEFLKEK
ncbi:DNA polymerase IV [Virgibacillus soli]|uniref:DNA polymerase IV n=1 Tax=Paracerasibacillus soli TaxID=480284 RepID=A0ABU5CPT5_9BACI|nr:DNA polymerase IV [Virgibacillus soli]MDY0408378.1 DNA polymerase IV [Virgibacillus soli]